MTPWTTSYLIFHALVLGLASQAGNLHGYTHLIASNLASQTHQDTCPVECQKPHCVNGAPWNGGKSLAGNVCEHLCSKKFGETRRELNISWRDAFFQHKHMADAEQKRFT